MHILFTCSKSMSPTTYTKLESDDTLRCFFNHITKQLFPRAKPLSSCCSKRCHTLRFPPLIKHIFAMRLHEICADFPMIFLISERRSFPPSIDESLENTWRKYQNSKILHVITLIKLASTQNEIRKTFMTN